jgi:hypothetical protein
VKNKPVDKRDVRALEEFTNYLILWLRKNGHTAKKLKLRGKFAGSLGEALAMLELYKRGYIRTDWRGVNKKGADIVLFTKKGNKGIQIKTTTNGRNVQLFVSKIKTGKKLRKKIKLNKVASLTPQDRKRLGINKFTLWYMQKHVREGKRIKVYGKVMGKLAD